MGFRKNMWKAAWIFFRRKQWWEWWTVLRRGWLPGKKGSELRKYKIKRP